MTGWWVVGGVLLLSLAFGWFRAATSGRRRAEAGTEVISGLPGELGSVATFVQFSSEFCAPCRATARLLESVAARHDGVVQLEVDVATDLALAQEWGIMRTPTVLVLDGGGRLHSRIVGVPRREAIDQALDGLAKEVKVS